MDTATSESAADVAALNQLRLEEDLTYADLGERIGIHSAALHRILNGRSEPIDRTLFKIRKFLETRDATSKRAPKRRAS